MPLDKGNGVAILNSTDYYEKLDKIVNDRSTFVELQIDSDKHPLIAKENFLAYYIRKYLKSVEGYTKLIPSGSSPGKLYGMAKVHKANVPIRLVVSMIGTPEYELSKFLDNFVKPYIPDRYLLKSTDHFMEKLKQFQFSKNQVMVSFDVVSLFTNVALSETIELIANRIYTEDNPNEAPFNRDIFKKLMLATQGIFMFIDRLYKQIDGVTMGSPLGPTLTNFFLEHLEEIIFAQNSSAAPKLFLRYIDDVYTIFDDNNSCTSFLSILNSQHKDIKFTVEKATKTLSFLDVEINITNNGFESWIWGKKTNTGVILNCNAICPKSWKTGLIMCLLKRTKTTCFDSKFYDKEICNLRSIFSKNAYPNWFLKIPSENLKVVRKKQKKTRRKKVFV